MKVLIAEDDRISRRLLQVTLSNMGHEVVTTEDGEQAWQVLQQEDAPQLAILDWMMPNMDGVEVCRGIRERVAKSYTYVILLTARSNKQDVVAGLEAGADDYLVKPFDQPELRSRIAAGERILGLQSDLALKVSELEQALSHVKTLQGLLPICMFCKKIRDDGDTWHRLETYIETNSGAMFTHSLCKGCLREHFPQHADKCSSAKD